MALSRRLPRNFNAQVVNRIIDANTNRVKEGLRVCEEIARFVLNNKALTFQVRELRHRVKRLVKGLVKPEQLLQERQSDADVGRYLYGAELKRKNIGDIFFANIQRVKESLRVLEEFSKLINTRAAIGFKQLRYDVYSFERGVARSKKI